MTALLTFDTVSLRTPDGRSLLDNLTFSLGRERVGLVGRNGVGKTTLLRAASGEIPPAAGAVRLTGRAAVLEQSFGPPAGATLADLLGVTGPLALLDRIGRGEARPDELEAADWTLTLRIEAALARAGLGAAALDRPAAELSGGQATRAGIARLLLALPDLILLDEPTNNLDVQGRAAVAELLAGWEGGALVVSHDRDLLAGMDRILELTTLEARLYGGGWNLYRARRELETAAAERSLETAERDVQRAARAAQVARERKDRRDAAGRRARARGDAPKILLDARAERAEGTGARLNRLAERQQADAAQALETAAARVERLRRLAFDLPKTNLPAGRTVLAFEDVAFGWPDGAPLIEGLSFRLVGPERVAVTGPNGAGKTTLIRLATGALKPHAGRVVRGVPAALLDQQASLLDDGLTLVDNFRRRHPAATANQAHEALARFLFRNTEALKLAGALSGGERLRAALACVLWGQTPPQLLILDEPTNHLDLASIEAVEAALAAYDGALLAVSHDGRFLDAIGIERRIALAGR
jgi:ATPase subunit of ABC transporter with duplicated ATPase domains